MKLAEQAVPSYLHAIPLVSFTFWRRLRLAARICRRNRKLGVCLDFGSGTGVLIPLLQEGRPQRIIAVESETHSREILTELANEFQLPHLTVFSNWKELATIPDASVDTITALDVLEHIENLDEILGTFHRILKPHGVMVVSSPTESRLYRFARRFGGPEFTGHYHVSNADQVELALKEFFEVHLEARLYPMLEFFRIVTCRKRP